MGKKTRVIDFRYNLSLYWDLLKNYKLYGILILFFILLNQTSYVIDKFLFKTIVDYGTEFSNNTITRNIFVDYLVIVLVIFFITLCIRAISKWFTIHFITGIDAGLMLDLKEKFFSHIIYLSHKFHTNHKTGSLISRLIRGSGSIERMTDVIGFNFVPLIFQLFITAGSIFYFDQTSALIILLFVFVFITYSYIINRLQQDASLRANEAEDIEKANISDFFSNIESIKYFGKEKVIKRRYSKVANNAKDALLKHWGYYRYLDAGHMMIIGLGIFCLLYFPILKFLDGAITIGTLVFIYTAFLNLMGPIFGFVHGIKNFYRAMAGFENLFIYHKITNEVIELPNATKLKVREGKIEFKDVNFKYKNRKILSNFNLVIPENKKVALVGPSGAGKSTVIKLLFRLYDLDKGEFFIDNKNIREVKKESLRSELSIVPQECILFDDTIFNNIKFSNPSAKKLQVFNSMKFSQLHKIVKLFPYQEKTIVGERGVKLSGGEKQRVSIARAILANKKILVLDEATSSLDSATEHEIQKALETLMKGRTSIIIAHRLSTIMKADIIVVMDKGKVVQKGTHKQLIKQKGMYRKLWNLQKGGYIK